MLTILIRFWNVKDFERPKVKQYQLKAFDWISTQRTYIVIKKIGT